MSSKITCIAPGCESTNYDTDSGVTFHQLPKNIDIRNQWLINMGPPTGKIFERSKLCSLHFDNDCYEHSRQIPAGIDPKSIPGANRLKRNAIPTLFGTRKKNCGDFNALGNLGEPAANFVAFDPLKFRIPKVATKSVHVQTVCEKKMLNMQHRVCQAGTGINDSKKMVEKSCQTLPLQSLLNSYLDKEEVHYDYGEEVNEEEEEDDGLKHDLNDISSELPEDDIFTSKQFDEDFDPLAERKFIIFEGALLQLFKFCFQCLALCKISTSVNGTCLIVRASCPNHHVFEWKSQPYIGRNPAGNILTAAAILFSGINPTKALRMLSFVGIEMYERTAFFRMQKAYLFRALKHVWEQDQISMLESLRDKPLTIGGVARLDSPGFCSKYGNYSFLENSLKKVIHFVLIKSNRVKNSMAIELEGCIQGLKFFIEQQGLNIVCMVTNRHAQISTYLKNFPYIKHLFYCWNLVQSVKYKIAEAAKTKGCEILAQWNRSIQNHLYWIARSSSGDTNLMRAKWMALLNHIINKHEGHGSPFDKCAHDPILPTDRKTLWLSPISNAYGKLRQIFNTHKEDIGFASPIAQTPSIESFHSVLIHFAPKNTHYSLYGMYARLILAVLHFNENSARIQSKTESGKRRWFVVFPNSKSKEPTVKPIMVGSTYEYVTRLIKVACEYSDDPINEGIEKTLLELEAAIET